MGYKVPEGKESIHLYLPSEQIKRLHSIRGQTREPISGIVETALEEHLARRDRTRRDAALATFA